MRLISSGPKISKKRPFICLRKTISYSVSSIQKVMIENVVGLIFDQALPQFMTCISSQSDKKGSTIMNWDIQNELMLLKIRVYQ